MITVRNHPASGRPPRALRRIRRAAALPAVTASAAVALAACGGSSSSNTSSAPAGADGGSYASQAASSSKLARFSQCVRAHGLSDFPDPVNGHLNVKVTKGSDLDPSSPAYQSALQACKSLEPAGFGSGSAESAGQQSRLVKFSQCMRKNGVPNFPDPQPNGAMLIQGTQVDSNSPQFQQAMQACRSLLPAGAVGG
jgi:hypothetical protein